jgi:hypothetical protein
VNMQRALVQIDGFIVNLPASQEREDGGRDGEEVGIGDCRGTGFGSGGFVRAAVAGSVVGGSVSECAWRGGAPGEAGRKGNRGGASEGEFPDFIADFGREAEEGGGRLIWGWG